MSRVSVQARHVSPVVSALVDRYEIDTTAAEPAVLNSTTWTCE
jgi:hypothetical protein